MRVLPFLLVLIPITEGFLGALISGAAAVAKMAVKHAIKAGVDAAKAEAKRKIKEEMSKKRIKILKEKHEKKEKNKIQKLKVKKIRRVRGPKEEIPDHLDDYDELFTENIIERSLANQNPD